MEVENRIELLSSISVKFSTVITNESIACESYTTNKDLYSPP